MLFSFFESRVIAEETVAAPGTPTDSIAKKSVVQTPEAADSGVRASNSESLQDSSSSSTPQLQDSSGATKVPEPVLRSEASPAETGGNVLNLGTDVVVGYGKQTKRSVSGSIASASAEDLQDRSYINVTQILAGKLPGVNITQSQGAPGSSPVIKIRGSSSITAGTSPLYVIDGLPMENFNLNMLNTQDIASVDVLKDAAAASIYGSRGANGVIIITTKVGTANKKEPGKPNLSVTYEHGIQQVAKTVAMMNAQQFIDYYIAAKNNAWVDKGGNSGDNNDARPGTTYDIPPDFLQNPGALGVGTDWQDVLFRTAPSENFQFSINGCTESTQYLMSLGYLDQSAVIDNNYYKRFTARTNLKQMLSDKWTLGGNLAFTGIHDRTDGTNGKVDVVSLALQSDPIFPVYNENGNLGFKDPNSAWYRFATYSDLQLRHPYSMTREIAKQNRSYNTIGTCYLEFSPMTDLVLRSSGSGNLFNTRFNSFRNTNQKYGYSTATPAEANESSSSMFNWLTENTLSYDKLLGDHNFKGLLGYTAQKQRDEYTLVRATAFPSDQVHTLNAGTVNYGTSSASEWSMLSYLARINYDFKSRYFLTGAIRRDGSSRFGDNHRWGYFPSASAAWMISDEDFLKDVDKLSNLKLKASYGLTGNNQIPNYGAISVLGASNYVFGNAVVNGQKVQNIANPDLKWEKTSQFNLGLEVGLFGDRISFVPEYYYSVTNDLLLFLPVPDITGFSTQLTNVGKLQNNGIDFSLISHNLTGPLKWTTNLNLSMNRNKVVKLGPENTPIYFSEWDVSVKTEMGQPISNYWGYQFDGVYKDAADLAASPHLTSAKPGDPKIRDVNGDGKITSDDKMILGNIQPKFTAGFTNTFSYKDIELSVMLQGSYGGKIVNQQWRYNGVWNGGRNLYADAQNYWRSPENPGDGVHFRPTIDKLANQGQFSNLWVEDASFLRVKNIRLSYTLPSKLTSRTGLHSTKLYINVENAFLFTKYSGYDPENTTYNATTYSATGRADAGTSVGVSDTYNSITSSSTLPTGAMLGVDFGSYPIPRVISFGVSVDF
jgi:TonB-linked SusC/RagA family outer membrane protein